SMLGLEQTERGNVILRMNAALHELFGLAQVFATRTCRICVQECVDRIAGTASHDLICRLDGGGSKAGRAWIEKSPERQRSVVHVKHPIGECEHRRLRLGVA